MEHRLTIVVLLLGHFVVEAENMPKARIHIGFAYLDFPKTDRISRHIRVPFTVHRLDPFLYVYNLSGTLHDERVVFVDSVRCTRPTTGFGSCSNDRGTFISLEHFSMDPRVLLRIEGPAPIFSALLLNMSIHNNARARNFTCDLFDDFGPIIPTRAPPLAPPDTSIFGVIFLSVCAVLVCGLCTLWTTVFYYRRIVQHRKEKKLRQELAKSTEEMLAKSPVIIFEEKDSKDADNTDESPVCAICLEAFKAQDRIRVLVCEHSFHVDCIDPWLLSHQSCPLCNRNILQNPIPSISSSVMAMRSNDVTSDINSGAAQAMQVTSADL